MTGTGMLPEQQKAHELGEMDIEDEGRSQRTNCKKFAFFCE